MIIICSNELSTDDRSLAIGIARLFTETPKKTTPLAQKLINQAREELIDETTRNKVLTFIQSILVYKFPNLTPEEIAAMLNLSDDIEETAYYQSVLKKTKLKVVPILLETGLTVEQIAERLELDIEEVRKIVNKQ